MGFFFFYQCTENNISRRKSLNKLGFSNSVCDFFSPIFKGTKSFHSHISTFVLCPNLNLNDVFHELNLVVFSHLINKSSNCNFSLYTTYFALFTNCSHVLVNNSFCFLNAPQGCRMMMIMIILINIEITVTTGKVFIHLMSLRSNIYIYYFFLLHSLYLFDGCEHS